MSTLSLAARQSVYESLDERTRQILELRRGARIFKRRGWLMRRMLLVSDLVGLSGAFVLAQWVFAGASGGADLFAETLFFVAMLPVWVVMAKLYGLYTRDEERADHSTADEVLGVFHLVTVGTWLLLAISYVTHAARPELPKLLTFWLIAVAAIPLLRGAARTRCRRSLHYLQNTIIIGAGDVGQQVARKLLKHREYGINVVGFVDERPKPRGDDLAHLALLGSLDAAAALVPLLDVERVIVAFSNDANEQLLAVLRELNEMNVQVDVVPRFYDVLSPAVDLHSVEGLPLIGLRPPRLSTSSAFLKRGLDFLGAGLGLVLLAPFLAVVALAIKLTSRGPVFFRQVRMGAGKTTFRIVKFRTMVVDADARKAEVAHLNKHARMGGDPRMFKIEDDPRVTRIGRVLRRFSIDELPQLWNVLRAR